MGIVIKQSIKNTIITFIGFAIGAINVLYMYPVFLGKEYLGLTNYVLSAANILYPILSFGIQNTLIKFWPCRWLMLKRLKMLILKLFN